jgi:hypothetical protein
MKKIVLPILALVLIASGVTAVSAYEAHLINVESHVENALSVTPTHIDFGNVFPEEWLSENLTVQTSQSFRDENQDRVTSVNYSVWVEWKTCPGMDYAYLDNDQWVPGTGFYNWLGYFTYIAIDPVIMTAEAIGGDLILVGEPPPGTPGTAAKWIVDAPVSLHKVPPDANEEDEIMVFIDVPVFEGSYNSLTDPEPKPSGLNDPTWIIPDGSMDYTDLPRHPLYDPDGMDFGLDIKIQVIDVGTTIVGIDHLPVAVPDAVTTSKDNPVSGNVLAANPSTPDSDADGDPLTVTEVNGNAANVGSWFTLPSGAQLLVNADGSFTYDPNGQFASLGAGETDSDTFDYTITDGNGNFDSATVTVTIIGGMIWYVDNSVSGPGTGTLADPFNTLAAAEVASGPGDIIYIFEGSGVAGQDAGITLKDNQQLIGEGVALVVSSVTILPAGNPPTIANTAGNAVTLASGNTIRGLNISDTPSGHGIKGNTVGTATVNNVLISGAGGLVEIDTGTINMNFDNLVSTGSGATAIKLHNVGGAFSVTDNTSISGAGVSGIDIMNAAPGATFAFGDTSVSGAAGINLNTNSAASFTFNSLGVSATNGAGLVANNSGTVASTSQPTINSTGGSAININNTGGNVGGSNRWSFNGVTSLNSTSDGIAFTNVSQNITLTNIDIDNPFGDGIKLTDVTGAANVISEGSIDGHSTDGHGISLQGVTGTTTVQGANAGSKFEITNIGAGGGHSGLNMMNSGDLTVQYADFDDIGQSGDEHGVNIENPIVGNRFVSITDSYFANIGDVSLVGAGSAVDLEVTQMALYSYTGVLDVIIEGNDINGDGASFDTTNQAVNLDFTAGSGGTLLASVNNNDIDGVREAIAVIVQGDAGSGGNRNVLNIQGNTIDDVDNNGIEIDVTDNLSGSGNSTTRALITSNNLTAINNYTGGGYDPDTAIEVEARGASTPTLSVDINNNVITGTSNVSGERWDGNGITVGSAGSTGFAGTLSFDVESNSIDLAEDDGILVKADESANVTARLMGNTLGATAGNGIEIEFEDDPATMYLYTSNNEVGAGNTYDIETLITPTLNFECDPACPVGLGSTSGIPNLVSILNHNGNTENGGVIVAGDVANPGAQPYIVVASGTTPSAD